MSFRDRLSFTKRRPAKDVAGMPIPEERLRALRESDQFLVSYPRSGNTWVRCLLSDIISVGYRELGIQGDADALVPRLHRRDVEFLVPPEGIPRIFKSHNLRDLKGRRMVYLFRNPADSLISYFHFMTGQDALCERDRREPDEICLWLLPTWLAHVRLALDYRDAYPQDIHFVSYERLLHDGTEALRGVARFLGLSASNETLRSALDRNALSTLHSTAQVESAGSRHVFFGKGRRGSIREGLRKRTIRKIEAVGKPLYETAAATEATDLRRLTIFESGPAHACDTHAVGSPRVPPL